MHHMFERFGFDVGLCCSHYFMSEYFVSRMIWMCVNVSLSLKYIEIETV